jgi:addiction module HigA family antidote
MMSKPVQSPGTVLKLFLRGYQLNPTSLAKELKLSQATVRLLTLDKTKISVHVALRLAKFFSMKPEYWLDLQNTYDLSIAAASKSLTAVLKSIPVAKKPAPGQKTAEKKGADKKAAAKKPAKGAKAPAKRGPKPGAKRTPKTEKAAKSKG